MLQLIIGRITDLRFQEAIDKSVDPREIVKIVVVLVERVTQLPWQILQCIIMALAYYKASLWKINFTIGNVFV